MDKGKGEQRGRRKDDKDKKGRNSIKQKSGEGEESGTREG
jgi:hypothetical protein